ncbi:MAG TPA: hypothetical protein VIY48_13165 [Candidatus Paceibacterota bacterium]
MIELLIAVILIALVAYVVSLFLGQPAGLIAFVVLLLIVLLTVVPTTHLH